MGSVGSGETLPNLAVSDRTAHPHDRSDSSTNSSGQSPVPASAGQRLWSRGLEILRWRGPRRFLLLAVRELMKPLFYWHAYYIIQNDLQPWLPAPRAKGNFETTVYAGDAHLQAAQTALAGTWQLTAAEIALRIKRGDAVAVAFSGNQAVGYLWMTFCSGLELAFDTAWKVRPNEAVIYDTFVCPEWRGRGIHACVDIALNNWAYPRGIRQAFASISAVNNQSLGITRLAGKARIMTLILVRGFGLRRTWIHASGAPFESYFYKIS